MDIRYLKNIWLLSYVTLAILCFILPSTSSALKRFNDACSVDTDCSTEFCHPRKKTCDCGPVKDYNTGKNKEQFYDSDLSMCLSGIGQICSLENADQKGLTVFRCIPDAVCAPMSKYHLHGKPSHQLFGSCDCKPGFQSTKNGLKCISNVELRAEKAPSTMDLQQEGWKSRSNSNAIVGKPYMTYASTVVIVLCWMFSLR